jgi:hypothetical protein
MENLYECSRCGVVSEADAHLCEPRPVNDKNEYCGTEGHREALCDTMKQSLPYVCGSCGRPAEQAELVCRPLVTG